MQTNTWSTVRTGLVVWGVLAATGVAVASDVPSAQQIFGFKPRQKGVEYDTPDAMDFDKCQVKVERTGKVSGWVVYGPDGQILRRFVDTNGDNVVDQWRYYQNGLEVYRESDTNFNNKIDQFRWFHSAGSRWGIDETGNGRIDRWKLLTAEEASREAVRALAAGDEAALKALLVTADELKDLGLKEELTKQVLEEIADPGQKMRAAASASKLIGPGTKWLQFSSTVPATIPADDGKASQDLLLYENAMAVVESDGSQGLVRVGDLVRIGDVWKLMQIPQALEGNQIQIAPSPLMLPPEATVAASSAAGGLSPEAQKLLEDLQKLDREAPAPTAGTAVLARYNAARTDLLAKLVDVAGSDQEREQWQRQMADGIAHSVQTGAYPNGLERLRKIETDVRRNGNSGLLAYVTYRRLLSEYSQKLKDPDKHKPQEVQEWWLKELEQFVEEHGGSDDAPDALLHLAINHEFSGRVADARKWYSKLAADYAQTTPGTRAAGAVRRLDMKDKSFTFSGPGLNGGTIDARQYRGKVLLVVYWATWCQPCTEDLPQLRALYQQHRGQGFEIVGVNLDTTKDPIAGYVREHRVPWPQVYEPGGLESGPAVSFGIISLPTMFLIDQSGKVVSRNISVADLKAALPDLLKK